MNCTKRSQKRLKSTRPQPVSSHSGHDKCCLTSGIRERCQSSLPEPIYRQAFKCCETATNSTRLSRNWWYEVGIYFPRKLCNRHSFVWIILTICCDERRDRS